MLQTPKPRLPPALPIEIHEIIISFIPELKNRKVHFDEQIAHTLAACSRVCRPWVASSQTMLFRHVRVDDGHTAHRFVASITKSPYLGEYVKEITLDAGYAYGWWLYRFSWVIRRLLPKLHSIAYAKLPPVHFHFYTWRRPSTLTSLQLSDTRFHSFGDFVRLISCHDCLQHLTIAGCWWDHPRFEGVYRFGQHWGRSLKSLVISRTLRLCGYDICYWLARGRVPRTFESLQIYSIDRRDFQSASHPPIFPPIPIIILNRWASTLTRLALDLFEDMLPENFIGRTQWIISESDILFQNPYREKTLMLDTDEVLDFIKACFKLQTLFLWENLIWTMDSDPFIERLPSILPSSLRCITIDLLGYSKVSRKDIQVHWKAVDESLGDVVQFPELEYVELRWTRIKEKKTSYVRHAGEPPVPIVDVKQLRAELVYIHKEWEFTRIFPHLIARGILWFSVRFEYGVEHSYAINVTQVEKMGTATWDPPDRPCEQYR
ncbi:hypothetical protein NLI96_g7971 [Meripilus lineatus]|uniref:F-box domain-containing protein n=1 Tax=Meripilus lineatus TaxID=2056292 RepID=A0AAD5V2W1_9APHY|nr:hypothetical protein NLI96_g7971 [Physisporinus lineatus]